MIRQSFNAGWEAGPGVTGFAGLQGAPARPAVTLPYDAMRDLPRSPDSSGAEHTGYFPGGFFDYTKPSTYRRSTATRASRSSSRACTATRWCTSTASSRRSGPTATRLLRPRRPYLRPGERNTIQVAGAGARGHPLVHRRRHLPRHAADRRRRASTSRSTACGSRRPTSTPSARSWPWRRRSRTRPTRRARCGSRRGSVAPDGAVVASGRAPVTLLPGAARGRARAALRAGAGALERRGAEPLHRRDDGDRRRRHARRGAHAGSGSARSGSTRSTGCASTARPCDLRGACIHHDNGLLGAATIPRAEERRVEILKAAGFNAIRSAHNPISRAMLDACDRLGMLVMDEAFDVWTEPKNPFDYSLAFPDWWERDVEAMVAKDFNHPSVIIYSIGNEIFEPARRSARPGAASSPRRSARSTTPGSSPTGSTASLSVAGPASAELMGDAAERRGRREHDDRRRWASAMPEISASDAVTERHGGVVRRARRRRASTTSTRATSSTRAVPEPRDRGLARRSRRTSTSSGSSSASTRTSSATSPGRAGTTSARPASDASTTPTRTTSRPGSGAPIRGSPRWVGDIDITGHRRPMSYYRETVFGLRRAPYIAVHRPQFHGRASVQDAVGVDGLRVELELGRRRRGRRRRSTSTATPRRSSSLLNGRSLGRAEVGQVKACLARFDACPTSPVSSSRSRTWMARSGSAARCGAPATRCASPWPPTAPRSAPTTPTSRTSPSRSRTRTAPSRATATGGSPSTVSGRGRAGRARLGEPADGGAVRRLGVHDLRRPRAGRRAAHRRGRDLGRGPRRGLRARDGHGDCRLSTIRSTRHPGSRVKAVVSSPSAWSSSARSSPASRSKTKNARLVPSSRRVRVP